MNGGFFLNNAATADGGAVRVDGGSATMSGGEMKNNTAVNGGAMYVNGTVTMSNGTISNNGTQKNDAGEVVATTNHGGAVYVTGGNMTILHGSIDNNSAYQGGAVYMAGTESTLLTMESGTMNGNSAADDGGAIYATGGTIEIGLVDCQLEDTDAALAACTHHTAKGSGRHHPKINNNTAADCGGGIAIANQGVVHFYCGEATLNEALYKGVGKNVFMDGGEFHLYNGANIGVPRDPDLVIIGGKLFNECVPEDKYVTLQYYKSNEGTEADAFKGLGELNEYMNLPDGEYFWDAPSGYRFFGWTAKGHDSGGNDLHVRNKSQCKPSGTPVEIIDKATNSLGADQGTYDGTEDMTMHLYALWAPEKSDITYVDGLTKQVVTGHAPAQYEFHPGTHVIDIKPIIKPGYSLVGWYLYQDEGQNANWGLEPVYKAGTEERTYANLDLAAMKDAGQYYDVGLNGTLKLEAGNTNFGDITLIAMYVPAYTDLKIVKAFPEGADYSIDENQTFLFHITGKPDNQKLDDIDLTVSITGPGEIVIKDMPVGNYTIEELTDWSWRYTVDQKERTVDLNNPEVTEIVTFTNTRTEDLWLSGDSYCSNWWGGGTATDRKVVKRNKNGNGNT